MHRYRSSESGMKKLKVVELFAGVGGFHIGLDRASSEDVSFEVVWSNQWEPSTKKQHASLVYQARFPESKHRNENIETVIEEDFNAIPDHDLLVGGFPCQDYSVATSLRSSKGLRGKKGILWWSIEAILRKKGRTAPRYLMLENVDRLLISPAGQRGRDFAIMLRSLSDLGYAVEWRVINAADYGMPQRRRRVFIMAYRKGTSVYKRFKANSMQAFILKGSPMAKAFPAKAKGKAMEFLLDRDIVSLSKHFNQSGEPSPFLNGGGMKDGKVFTISLLPDYDGPFTVLEDIIQAAKDVPEGFWITDDEVEAKGGWRWQKSAKRIDRISRSGHPYTFSEGAMSFPDTLDRPSRTIITAEGGRSPSRFKHIIQQDGRYRRLTPMELERLNLFPDGHTELDGIPAAKRAFFMGNALVVGVVERLGKALLDEM
jgi:DNA (cytosine-5)-methyltransferase 1